MMWTNSKDKERLSQYYEWETKGYADIAHPQASASKSLRSRSNPWRVRIKSFLHSLDICNRVVALSTSCRTNVAAVNFRPIPDHELVHTAAHERVHAQLEALSYAYLFRQKTIAPLPRVV